MVSSGLGLADLPKMSRAGILIFVIINLVTMVFSGVITGLTAGDWKPLLHNTIGTLLAGDNQAVLLIKDLEVGFPDIPEQHRSFYKDSVIHKIGIYILINGMVYYFLFKIIHWVIEWNADRGAKGAIFAFFLTFIFYFVVSIMYFVFVLNKGKPLSVDQALLAGVPLKTVYYLIDLLIRNPGVIA